MPAQRERGSRRHEEEHASDVSASEQSGRPTSAETSVVADDIIDEIDRVLKEHCGFGADEIVDPEEFERRAEVVNKEFTQKPGQ
jgi:hypothetical protein